MEEPTVFILDIDGTLIGDIRPQIMLYELHNSCKKTDKKTNILNFKTFQDKLRHGIVRPYAIKFIKNMKKYNPNSEFFIYTAAERTWATFLINQIEKTYNIKFHRPLFTRDNCSIFEGEHKKNISTIIPVIVKSLRKKYPRLSQSSLNNRILIVDNTTSVFDSRDQQMLVTCPSYDFKYPENLPICITDPVYHNHQKSILNILAKNVSASFLDAKSYFDFQLLYYKYYVNYLSNAMTHNRKHIQDKFFLVLMNYILKRGIMSFDRDTVKTINQKINTKLRL